MHTELVASHVLLQQHLRPFNDTRSNDEERREQILGAQVIEKRPRPRQ